jgi:hypothetical protein
VTPAGPPAYRELDGSDLQALVGEVSLRIESPRRLYLLGATSHLAAGLRQGVDRFDLVGDPDAGGEALASAVRSAAAASGLAVRWEHPGDVIPLPEGHRERARDLGPEWRGDGRALALAHFDPYSVVLRLLARGDEPDYEVSLDYLRAGWIEMGALEAQLAGVLPRFTNQTIQQDPAEFRRKFRGLRQMWVAERTAVRNGRRR